MNTYDAKHLHLLSLIQGRRWAEITQDDIHELNVLITCKYIMVKSLSGHVPDMTLNPEGVHYLRRLCELNSRSIEPGFRKTAGSLYTR